MTEEEILLKIAAFRAFSQKTSRDTFDNVINKTQLDFYKEPTNIYLFQTEFYGINKFGNAKTKDYLKGKDIDVQFGGDLRDYQIKVIDNVIPKIKQEKGGTISLPPGRGKTVISCKIICELKKKM